jgi:purine-binding chemotaxis protein CheW
LETWLAGNFSSMACYAAAHVGGAQGRLVNGGDADLALVCHVQGRLCALPLDHVIETMRPLSTTAIAGAPHFVCGVAVIRGAPVPVLDVARLLGGADASPGRFITLSVGMRRVALAVASVLGVRVIPSGSLSGLPPLLHEAGSELVASIGLLDEELLWVLQSSRLLSEGAWAALDSSRAAA